LLDIATISHNFHMIHLLVELEVITTSVDASKAVLEKRDFCSEIYITPCLGRNLL
jgi:hypothetical protein